MSNEPVSPDPELTAIEAALGALEPARSRIDRDLVMFRAGQGSVRPSRLGRHAWNVIAASVALIACGEGIMLAHRPSPQIIKEVVVIREPAPAAINAPTKPPVAEVPVSLSIEPSLSLGETARDRMFAQVLRYGLDGLPNSPTAISASSASWPASSGQMLKEELRNLLAPGDPS